MKGVRHYEGVLVISVGFQCDHKLGHYIFYFELNMITLTGIIGWILGFGPSIAPNSFAAWFMSWSWRHQMFTWLVSMLQSAATLMCLFSLCYNNRCFPTLLTFIVQTNIQTICSHSCSRGLISINILAIVNGV